MTNKFVALLMAVGLCCSANTAMADGYAASGAAAAAASSGGCGGPFQGWHVGGHIGYMDQDLEIYGGDDSDSGFTGGLLSGYNHQCGRLVVGYSGDINIGDTDAEVRGVGTINGGDDIGLTSSSSIDWYGTERLRIGFVHDNSTLFYATGGLAYARVENALRIVDDGGDPLLSRKNDDYQWGFAIGGGVEFLRHERWTLRAEALYINLSDTTEQYTISTCTADCDVTEKYDNDFWVARLGLTYKLGSREEVAPLK